MKYAYIIYFQSCIVVILQNHYTHQHASTITVLVLKFKVLLVRPLLLCKLHLFITAKVLALQAFL